MPIAVSIGLETGGDLLLGVVYDPTRDELFVGERGGGATLNGAPIRVSTTPSLGESLLTTGFPYNIRETTDTNLQEYAAFSVRFENGHTVDEDGLRAMVAAHGISIANLNYRLREEGKQFEYRMVLRTLDSRNLRALSTELSALDSVRAFQITPTND